MSKRPNIETGAEPGDSGHSAICLRLMQLFPRVTRGMRRRQDLAAPETQVSLGPRHVAALQQLRDGPISVGALASRLGLNLSTVSGVLADLDRAGLVARQPDESDRRRTLVQMAAGKEPVIDSWLDGAAQPLARVLDRLEPGEQAAFLKAMSMLEDELRAEAPEG